MRQIERKDHTGRNTVLNTTYYLLLEQKGYQVIKKAFIGFLMVQY